MQMPNVKMNQESFFALVYHNLKIYTDTNDMISSIALSATERAISPSQTSKRKEPTRYNGRIIKKSQSIETEGAKRPPRPRTAIPKPKIEGKAAEFEIIRGNNEYEVKIEKVEKDV